MRTSVRGEPMQRFVMEPKVFSRMIREKKKKLAESDPTIMDSSPVPDMDAQDVYDMEEQGRIEETLNTPHKINADQTDMDETYAGVGVTPVEKSRMMRLRKYMDGLDLYAPKSRSM